MNHSKDVLLKPHAIIERQISIDELSVQTQLLAIDGISVNADGLTVLDTFDLDKRIAYKLETGIPFDRIKPDGAFPVPSISLRKDAKGHQIEEKITTTQY